MGSTADTSAQVQIKARQMFARVLSQWACDLMNLRQTGGIRPATRDGRDDMVLPYHGQRPGAALAGKWTTGEGSIPRWARKAA